MKRRLSVDIPAVVHAILLEVCKKRHLKITTWVMRAIVEKFIRDGEVAVEN